MELNSMSRYELQTLAQELNIPGRKKARLNGRMSLITLIRDAGTSTGKKRHRSEHLQGDSICLFEK
jgi:hypothetical protein